MSKAQLRIFSNVLTAVSNGKQFTGKLLLIGFGNVNFKINF